jgi:hypothetical protein
MAAIPVDQRPRNRTAFFMEKEVQPKSEKPIEQGDRVEAATAIDTTQGVHIDEGERGTVAEDRGSTLVVAFDERPGTARVDDDDLRKVER